MVRDVTVNTYRLDRRTLSGILWVKVISRSQNLRHRFGFHLAPFQPPILTANSQSVRFQTSHFFHTLHLSQTKPSSTQNFSLKQASLTSSRHIFVSGRRTSRVLTVFDSFSDCLLATCYLPPATCHLLDYRAASKFNMAPPPPSTLPLAERVKKLAQTLQ